MTEYRPITEKQSPLFYPLFPGAACYSGRAANSISYVESAQLLDPALWKLFVDIFRKGNADDGNSGWRGEYWGKMMRGAAMTYRYTQNESLYKILTDTVRDLLSTADDMGRIASYSTEKEFSGWDLWSRKYVMLGLLHYYEICRNERLKEEILTALCRHADYLTDRIGDVAEQKLPITHTSVCWDGLNSSSILEPFVKLYKLTGKDNYMQFAKHIVDAGGLKDFNLFEAALRDEMDPYQYPVTKAYEMISNFEGILELYRVTGEEKYLTMTKNFARRVMASDITVIGCAGTTHELFDHSAVTQFDPAFNGIMQETCVTVTWMKFCCRLLALTGDAVYADQLERSVYNALLGSLNINHHVCYGQVFTFDSYSPLLLGWRGREVGGQQKITPDGKLWGCCVAIGAAGTALIAESAVMQTEDGAAMNLYLPGESKVLLRDGKTVLLQTETAYPKDGIVRIKVVSDEEASFKLSLRIPAWSEKTTLTINGEAIETIPGTYANISRTWRTGDIAELSLDMRIQIIRASDIDPQASETARCHAALRCGPVMLGRDSAFGEDIRIPITLTDNGGYAESEPCTTEIPTEQAYRVRTTDGTITVADYASLGHTEWREESPITVWIKTKE